MGKQRFKNLFVVFTVVLWVHGSLGSLRAESAFWDERRAQSARQRSLPERAGRLQLAALPTPHRITLASPDPADSQSVGNPLGFPLPLECGSVRKITSPHASHSSRVVIHIQDVHHNEAAQRKIGRAIESLVSNGSIGLVALEGAYGPIEIGGLRRFSRPDILRTVADYLLRVHDISGPVHSAITGNQAFPPIVGVDDAAHYRANVAAYQRAEPRQRATQEVLKRVQVDLDRRCEEGLNQPLLAFVKLAQSFHNEITPLGTYIRALLSDAPKKAVGSSLVWFQEALELEGRLDFKQVEREREDLLGVLLRRLNAGDIEKLTQKSTAYRLGKILYSEFYGDLRALCAQNGVDPHRFPQMDMYIRYVLMADKIDPETLFTDLRALEGAILAQRIKSPSEKRLVEETTVLGLAKKLAAFSLTTEEWNQYTSLSKDFLFQEGLSLQDFEVFYREAQARDTAMADNVLREMKNNPSKPAVLVTGGFHSSGLTDQLIRAGVTVVRFTPRIEKIDTAQGSAYLSVFSQEKTPLESLFQGQKLFLATSPANVEKFSFLAAITAAVKEKDPAARARIFGDIYKETAGLLGFDNIKRVIPKIKVKDSADGKKTYVVQWKGKSSVVSFTNEKIVDFHPLPREDSMWGRVIAFLKRLAGKITRRIPLKVVADRESGLPRVDLTEAGTPGFAKERLLSAFHATRNTLIERGRPDGKPYFPYLYESRDREVVIEADGIKIVLVDVAERAGYDKPSRLSEFARHPRDIREGHPNDKCVFCRLMRSNSDEFFAQVQGTGRNVYRATVNLGEYGYPHFQFISENPVPNLYDRDNRFMDYLLSARALGPEFGVMINGPFSGASQRHLHWHAIKIKAGGLWAYLDSLSPPDRKRSTVREVLSNYPGHPILFRGTSRAELNNEISKELGALYDQQISAGVHARVKMDGTFEVVVAPTRGEAMVSFDIVLNESDEEFEKHRVAVRNYNLFGIIDPSFDPIAEGMGATHTPGNYPNILMELTDEFRMNSELQRRTADRLIKLFGDYNPKKFPSERRLSGTTENSFPESRGQLDLIYQSFRPDFRKMDLDQFQGDALVVAQFVAGEKKVEELFAGGEALTQRLEGVIGGVRAILLSHDLVVSEYVDLYERQVFHSSFFVLRRTSNAVAPKGDIDAAQRLAEEAFNNSVPYGLVFERTVINNNTLLATGYVEGDPRTPSLARNYLANRPDDGFEKKRSSIFGISLGRFKKPLPRAVLLEIESYLKNQGSHENPLGRVLVDKAVVFTHRGPNIHKTPLHVHSLISLGQSRAQNNGSGSSIMGGTGKPCSIAVDIGGTSIVAVVMDPEGQSIVSERIETQKLEPRDFYDRVGDLILKVKGMAEEKGLTVSPHVGIGSPGRFVSELGGRVIAGTSAPNLGPRPESFKGANPEAILSEKLPGMTIVVHNDAVAQMAGQLDQLLTDKNNEWLKATSVAYIGPGTGLGGGFAVIDDQGRCSYPTDGHIYDLVIDRNGVTLSLNVGEKIVDIEVVGMAEDVISGRAVIDLLRKVKTAVSDAGLPAVFTSVDNPDGRTLNDVLSGSETDSIEYAIAHQIAQFEGQMLGRVMEFIYLGQIEKWTPDAEWPKADKDQVKGIVNFLLGGSVPQGQFGQIMRETGLKYLAGKYSEVQFRIIAPVIDGKEAGLRGAASFVKPSTPESTRTEFNSAQTPFTRRMWKKSNRLFREDWRNSLAVEARFTAILEFILHWLSPALIVYAAGLVLAGAGYGVSPEVLVTLFFPIQASIFYKSHGIRGPPPLRVVGFMLIINWVGAIALMSGGWLAFHGIALMALGILWHTQYDESIFKQNRTSQGLTKEEVARVRVLIPAGGKGSRLYPVGDKLTSPQLGGGQPLLKTTIGRMTADFGNGLSIHPNQVFIVGSSQRPREPGDVANVPANNILNAPAGAPLPDLLWALAHLKMNDPDATVVIGQGDNYFGNPANYNHALEQAIAVAQSRRGIVEMGLVPRSETFDEERRMGHGYYALPQKPLEENVFSIVGWEPKAEDIPPYFNSTSIGRYICSGVFVGNIGAIETALKAVYPDQYKLYAEMVYSIKKGDEAEAIRIAQKFPKTVPSPFEGQAPVENSHAYLHRAMVNADHPGVTKFVVLANFPWADLGVWKNFRSLPSTDSNGNVVLGDSQAGASTRCIFYAGSPHTVDADLLEGILVAVDGGRVLVTTVDASARMGEIVGALEQDPEFSRSMDDESRGSLATGRVKLLNSPGCRVYAEDSTSVVLYGVRDIDVDVTQGRVFVRPRNILWPDVLAKKYRLVRPLYSGTNPDHVFLVEDREGQRRVIKYVDKPGIDGNGMPFIGNQIRRLLYLKKEIPQELNRFFPEVLDHAITDNYVYYVMPYFEGSEPPLMSFWDGKISLDKFNEEMTGLVRYLFSQIYNIRVVPNGHPSLIQSQHLNRMDRRFKDLLRREGDAYRLHHETNQMNVAGTEYSDSTQFFERLFAQPMISINGKRCLNYGHIRQLILARPDLLRKLSPTRLSVFHHGDLSPGNVLRNPDGSLVIVDHRGTARVDEPYDPVYDLAKIPYYYLVLAVRQGALHATARNVNGLLEFDFPSGEQDNKVRDVWAARQKIIESFQTTPEVLSFFNNEGDHNWDSRLLLAEASNMVSTTADMFWVDRKGEQALDVYLLGIYLLNLWAESEGLIDSSGGEPPVLLKNKNYLNRGVVAVQVQPSKLVVTLVGRDDGQKLTHAKLRREITTAPLPPTELFNVIAQHVQEVRDHAVAQGWDIEPLVGVTCPGSFVLREGRIIINPGSAPNLGPTSSSYDSVSPVEELSRRLSGLHVVVANDSETQLAFTIQQAFPHFANETREIALLDVRTGLGSAFVQLDERGIVPITQSQIHNLRMGSEVIAPTLRMREDSVTFSLGTNAEDVFSDRAVASLMNAVDEALIAKGREPLFSILGNPGLYLANEIILRHMGDDLARDVTVQILQFEGEMLARIIQRLQQKDFQGDPMVLSWNDKDRSAVAGIKTYLVTGTHLGDAALTVLLSRTRELFPRGTIPVRLVPMEANPGAGELAAADLTEAPSSKRLRFHPPSQAPPIKVVYFFPPFSVRSLYMNAPTLYGISALGDHAYQEAATALRLTDAKGRADPSQLSMSNISGDGEAKIRALTRSFVMYNLVLSLLFQEEIRKKGMAVNVQAYTGLSVGILTASAASGALSVGDAAKVADFFWWNVLKGAQEVYREDAQHITVSGVSPEEFSNFLSQSEFHNSVHIYHYRSPNSVQLIVPIGELEKFMEEVESRFGARFEMIKTPTRELAHTPLLKLARDRMEDFLQKEGIVFQNPDVPVIAGQVLLRTGSEIRDAVLDMVDQPMDGVGTAESISRLGPNAVIDVGFGERGRWVLQNNGKSIPPLSVTGVSDAVGSLTRLSRGERPFGKTGLSFLPMGLGTIWFGRRWPNNNQEWKDPSPAEVDHAIRRAFDQIPNNEGRVMIDTAAAYGKSEEKIGDFFRRYPAYARLAFIATKWGEEHDVSTGQSRYDHSVSSLHRSFGRSLARLGRVDLLYVHGTPNEIVDKQAKQAMLTLRQEGKVKFLGVSLSQRNPLAMKTILSPTWEGVFDVVQMPAKMFIENREFVQELITRGIAVVINSALPAYPELLQDSDVSMVLNGSRFHFEENAALLDQSSHRKPDSLAQTPLTKSVWKGVAGLFKISPHYKYFKHLEFAFTALWEFFLHWVAPFFVVSWLFSSIGLPLPDMWLIPVLAVILEPVFVGSHPFSAQGKDLTRLAHFLMSFYGSGGFLIAWGGWGPALGVVFIIIGLALHFFHDFFRAPPSSSHEENVERENANEVTNHSETVLRSVLSLPEPVDAQLRNATARFAFLAGLDEVAVRDRSAVKSKYFLLSLLDAYAKAGEGWKGNLSQVVNEENAGVWVVPVGSDWKSMGALARACLSSRGRDTEIRFIAENEAVALALRFWSFGRGRVRVRTVPKAFSPGNGDRRVVRLLAVQESLARDVVLRSGTAWRIVAPESIAMDYSGLAENSPLWNASVVFLDALLRALPVPAEHLRDMDNAASRLVKRMA